MQVSKTRLVTLTTAALVLSGGTYSEDAAACSASAFIGEVCQVGFNFCPRGFAGADGTLLAISQNTALFSLLGACRTLHV